MLLQAGKHDLMQAGQPVSPRAAAGVPVLGVVTNWNFVLASGQTHNCSPEPDARQYRENVLVTRASAGRRHIMRHVPLLHRCCTSREARQPRFSQDLAYSPTPPQTTALLATRSTLQCSNHVAVAAAWPGAAKGLNYGTECEGVQHSVTELCDSRQ